MSVPERAPSENVDIDSRLITSAEAIDQFEGYPNPHAFRIARIADAIAVKFEMGTHDRRSLMQAALLHDVGEMVMDRDYLKANRTLTPQERADMQRHPVIGEQETAKRGLGRAVQLIVRWHHEWWNGSGYPDGLKGSTIPLGARILRVSDTYAAMTDSRPHSVPISSSEAERYLAEWAGIEFDPHVVKVFLSLTGVDELASYADDD